MDQVQALPAAVAPYMEDLSVQPWSGRAHYGPTEQRVYMRKNPTDWSGTPDTAVHEIGHHLHYKTNTLTYTHTDPRFIEAAARDVVGFKKWAEQMAGPNWQQEFSPRRSTSLKHISRALGYGEYSEALPLSARRRVIRFTDAIMGISRGEYGLGHSRMYMRRYGFMEAFTHAWTAIVDKDAEFAKLFPAVTDLVRQILKL